ncbi:DUF4190 domain-containing protein [Plantactinospora sp. CA-290183]|uniref:DUF4190 domain-containing protein n=1 Tax=Plantactinospora sp. CA-290183 TaxID=3240006 RepID=UPI003D8AF04F
MSYPPPGEPRDQPEQQPPYGERPADPGPPPGQYGQPPSYGEPSPYGQPPPYGEPGQYGQPPQYGQPGQYGQPPRYGQSGGTNVLAILSLVFAFVFAPAGIVLGHLARRQISQTGEQGGQLATWGLILSYIFTALYLIGCCGWLALVGWAGSDGGGGSF